MHLKHLEVSGFKSFADNIKLDFEPGITAVVGPNGCGKSNIIDAIRWCLGEMSAKSLRSSMMMDVVFNGSGSRPPQNMAQVTLTFDNSDKRLPIDFSDVSISRRLFRSGESEYFINKTQCRLRDIKELFLDTGMGEDGYSSLEQGKVEWVLQAKPEERRELFEEAAGVSKYRARREEALRKLERVDIDLSRLADIISVTDDQIRKLENAVAKAKTYERIRGELKVMEIQDWLFQLSNTDQELSDIHARLANAQSAIEQWNTQSHQLDTELAELRLSLTQMEEELIAANGHLHKIDSDIKIGEERLNNARHREQELVYQASMAKENLSRENQKIGELNSNLQTQSKQLDEIVLSGESIEADFTAAKNNFDNAQSTLQAKLKDIKTLRDQILDRAQERARLNQQLSHLTSDLARCTSQIENVNRDMTRVSIQKESVGKVVYSNSEQIDQFRQLLASATQRMKDIVHQTGVLTSRLEELRNKRSNNSEDIAHLKAKINAIKDQQTEDPYLAGVQAIQSGAFPNIYGPIARLIQCENSHRDIISSTLGEHLGDMVADSAADAEKAIQFLKEEGKGRVRIWILDRVPSAASDTQLGVVPSGQSLASLIRTDSKFSSLISLLTSSTWIQEFTAYGRAVVNGGSDPSQWKTHMVHRIPEMEQELQEKEQRQQELNEAIQLLETEISSTGHRKEASMKEMEESRVRLELAEEEKAKNEKHLQLLGEEFQTINAEIAQLEATKEQKQVAQAHSSQAFEALQSQEASDHQQLDSLQHNLTETQNLNAQAAAELASNEERRNAFIQKRDWQLSIKKQIEKDIENAQSNMGHYENQLKEVEVGVEAAKSTQKDAAQLIEESISKRELAAQACSDIQIKRTAVAEKIQGAEINVAKVRSELKSAQEIVQTELIKESTLSSRNDSLVQKLREQYELEVPSAKEQFQPVCADPETLDKLKKRVANIGPINLAAPQEHAELVEKSTFLTTQQNDLLKAKDDLKQVIAKINSTTREHFRETFAKVRENFRALYGLLFQGGEADLRFTDEADILNTGIDIFCQPPGKKLLHISLLSGGEKALTAIALLFAFFQVRPSPVALMDEVDAPLDEANVLRYVDMIKKFSVNSQFILISHNKRTMEAANTLYGVTMEELGVSKVLSARLQKAQDAPVEPTPAASGTN